MDIRPEDVVAQAGGSSLVLNSEGAVVSATGDFSGDAKAASRIYNLVLDAGGLIGAQTSPPHLKRISVTAGAHTYIISVSNQRIYAVKRS